MISVGRAHYFAYFNNFTSESLMRRKSGSIIEVYKVEPGAIIRDGDRKRGVHASPCVVPKKLFLEKIAPPFTS